MDGSTRSSIGVFNRLAGEYDRWFVENDRAYRSELEAVRRLMPAGGEGIEIGVGTGRFAAPLSIRVGVEPAHEMAEIARSRGIEVHECVAEDLPFGNECFDFALMVTLLCFVDDPRAVLREAWRVLRKGGRIVLGIIDADSPLGRRYEEKKASSDFYKLARFRTAKSVAHDLVGVGFGGIQSCQTVFERPAGPDAGSDHDPVMDGYGAGLFVVLKGEKI